MQNLETEEVSCEICHQSINRETSPKFWWEKHREGIDEAMDLIGVDRTSNDLKMICQSCGEKLNPEEMIYQLEGFHKHYWDEMGAIFSSEKILGTLITIVFIILIIGLAILIFGTWFPFDIGY